MQVSTRRFFYSPAPANRLAVFSTAGRRASAGPQIHVFLAMLPCPSKTRHTRFFKNKSKGPHTVDQNRSDGPAYGAGALRLSRCRSKYPSAALNNIIHDE